MTPNRLTQQRKGEPFSKKKRFIPFVHAVASRIQSLYSLYQGDDSGLPFRLTTSPCYMYIHIHLLIPYQTPRVQSQMHTLRIPPPHNHMP
jgi:hypothetical protein